MTLDEYMDCIGAVKCREDYRKRLIEKMSGVPVQVIRYRIDAPHGDVTQWLCDNMRHKFHIVRFIGYVMFEDLDEAMLFKLTWG